MRYPLYVWKDEGSVYGGALPDLPGVFTAADELDDLPAMAQEAVLAMYEHADTSIPTASTIDRWREDQRFQNGFWMLVDIAAPLNPRADRPGGQGLG